jgi:hypothetical protein
MTTDGKSTAQFIVLKQRATLFYGSILQSHMQRYDAVKLPPFPQPQPRTRTYAQTYPSAQRATQLKSVLARVYSVLRQNLNTTTVP